MTFLFLFFPAAGLLRFFVVLDPLLYLFLFLCLSDLIGKVYHSSSDLAKRVSGNMSF